MPSSPGAGPSHHSDIHLSMPTLTEGTIASPISELGMQKSFSSASSFHSATNLSPITRAASTSICTSPSTSTNSATMAIQKRKKKKRSDGGSIDKVTEASANETIQQNGHTKDQEEEETETEGIVLSFKSKSVRNKRSEEEEQKGNATTTLDNNRVRERSQSGVDTDGSSEASFYSSVETEAKLMDLDS